MLNYRDVAKIFEEIEIMLISSLKRNLGYHKNEEKKYGFKWSAWQTEKLHSIDKFRRENLRIMNHYTNIIDTATRQIMIDEFAQGMNGINTAVPEDIPGTLAEITREPVFFGVDDTKITRLTDNIVNLEKHAETAVLRTMDDVYRQTVNKAQLAMSTGTPLQKAVDMAMQDFLNKGINCIVYRDGRRVNVADYVRMALRTTAARAAFYGQSAKIRYLGYDTVLVSSYGMCSETCLPWQGRVYIDDVFSLWDGEIEERSDGGLWGKSHYCGKWFPLLSNALHGGLFHPNCRHTITMWRDGDSIPEPMDNSGIQRRYRLEQHQRQLENKVRKAKRFVAGQFDPANIKKANKLLREAQKELREFIAETNLNEGAVILKRDYGREKIYTANSQNGLTSADESVIINGRRSGKTVFTDSNGHSCNLIGKIDYNDNKAVAASLREFEEKYKDSDIEQCRVITVSGEVYEVHGDKWSVDTSILGDKLKGSINEHNHVTGESQYSFSWEDLKSCTADGTRTAIAFDEKYRYSMQFSDKVISEDDLYDVYETSKEEVGNIRLRDYYNYNGIKTISDEDEQYEIVKRTCEKVGIKYGRSKK